MKTFATLRMFFNTRTETHFGKRLMPIPASHKSPFFYHPNPLRTDITFYRENPAYTTTQAPTANRFLKLLYRKILKQKLRYT